MVVRLLGRKVTLEMTLKTIEAPNVVEYATVQRGLPDARHVRRFAEAPGGFDYTLIVEYQPRGGPRGFFDRVLVPRAVRRVFRKTIRNLQRALAQAGRLS